MKMINKPFFNALHYPALMPYQKEGPSVPHYKIPNPNVNQEVFDRLYSKAIVENQSQAAIRGLQANPNANIIVLNQQTGLIDVDLKLQNQYPEIYGESRNGFDKGQTFSAKTKNRNVASDAKLLKPRAGALSNIGPRIMTRSMLD